ncbi:MAG TPA: FtsX-like permease family protein, partial [Gammaproteobacteria bacterium]|nr:FtsX-like permease family protein [Gammaproteobacteria bacterium]
VRRASRRFYSRHPWQLSLAIAGISLGVAVYVGVDLANDSAGRAFELSSAIVDGQTSNRLLPVGAELPDTIYRELVTTRGITLAAPVVEANVGIPIRPGLRYPLLGIDPLEESGLRGFSGFALGSRSDFARLIAEPGTVLLPEALAQELGAAPGSKLSLSIRGRVVQVEVIGLVQGLAEDVEAAPPILTDIATAQELSGRAGVISHIDLRLDDEQARALAANLPPATTLVEVNSQNAAFAELASAFRTNLTALGLLALVVGTFLIYGTMSFAIVQRRATLGVLRALGLQRRELLASVMIEALALGAAATLIGLALGHVLARGLIDLVLRTIGDLYFTSAVTAIAASPWIYVKGAALGIGATLLAALKPALDASRAAPAAVMGRAQLERHARRSARRSALAALPVLGVGALLFAMGSRDLYTAFGGLFCVLAAGAMLTPAATMLLMRLSEGAAERVFRLPGVLAVRGVTASLSRTGVATAALAVAVATVIGVGLMIASFRVSLIDWLGTTLTADAYVAFDSGGDGVSLSAADLQALERIEGVRGISLSRAVRVPTPQGELAVRATQPGPDGWGLDIIGGEPQAALTLLAAGDGIVVSEPFAFRRELDVGDELRLPTAVGERSFEIAGVFRDFNTGGNSIVMALHAYRRSWGDSRLSGVGLHLRPESDSATVEADLRAALPDGTSFRMRSREAIERLSLEVFDRTFKITEVLRILAALVAFLGVLSALLSIELERSRELAVLRSIGFSPRQLATTLLTQTGLLGAAAGIAALPLGTALAALLVYVINRRSFGWSMDFVVTPSPLLTGLALAVGAALLAGVYPALRASRIELGAALREE